MLWFGCMFDQCDWLMCGGLLIVYFVWFGCVNVCVMCEVVDLLWFDELDVFVSLLCVLMWVCEVILLVDGMLYVVVYSIVLFVVSKGVWQVMWWLCMWLFVELLYSDLQVECLVFVSWCVIVGYLLYVFVSYVLQGVCVLYVFVVCCLVFQCYGKLLMVIECMLLVLWCYFVVYGDGLGLVGLYGGV